MVVNRLTWLALLLPVCLAAQERPPSPTPIDASEAARWGDRVVVVGEGPRCADDVLFSAAMAPPASDSEMWFITLWGKAGHAASTELHAAFQRDNHLTPFVATPPDTKRAWAHFNHYRLGDPTQAWRAKDFKITADTELPVVIIQPPLNKRFGDPKIVIDRIEAKDCADPAQLQKRITSSVFAWCKKLSEQRVGLRFAAVEPAEIGVDPPFKTTPPAAEPFNPQFPKFPGLTIDIGPKPLTLEEIEEAAGPDADPAFILAQHKEKPTSKKEVKLAWLVHKAERGPKPTPAVVPAVEPTPAPPAPDAVPHDSAPIVLPKTPEKSVMVPTSPPATTEPPVEVTLKRDLLDYALAFASVGLLIAVGLSIVRQPRAVELKAVTAALAPSADSGTSSTTSEPSPASSSPSSS